MNRPRCATDGPRKPLSEAQQRIANGIRRNLSYEEIAAELSKQLGRPYSHHTVRQHVRQMAFLFDHPEDMAPRMMIYVWMKHEEWTAEQKERQKLDRSA